ncbi:MAG: hypothetical protein V4725_03080 [Bacteroidota bacterium]|nr:hypothetical protein [Ferruginibacter sp.]
MKLSTKIALGLCILVTASVILQLTKRTRTTRMLSQISDEGYETAHDILFPGQKIGTRALHYGPVIPN